MTKKKTQTTEPVYRLAEQEWKHFIEAFTDVLTDVDPQVPPLPPKDVIHRIYRDVRLRFSLRWYHAQCNLNVLARTYLLDTVQQRQDTL